MVAADKKKPAEEDDSKNIKNEKLPQLIGFKCFLSQSLLFSISSPALSFYLTSFNFVFLQ